MTSSVGIDLNLDAASWAQSAGFAASQSNMLGSSLQQLSSTIATTQRVMGNAGSSSRGLDRSFGGFAASAAKAQQDMSGFNATQAVTGQRTDQLSKGIRMLARDLPNVGGQARATVSQFTQMGVSAKGTEQQVVALSKTMLQLAAGSGGSAPQYAASMTQLERTFGDQGLDPKRVQSTADALTTVSKLGGAPAQAVLDFSNNIGPMAQTAGIGKTATLGIATAFTRIGQDGTAAGTAVNKMLGDMSKAVRDGGPQMNTYGSIVGKTADQFTKLFKNNPAEALTQVTEAIGKAGNAGPRILEQLGLDGVRTMKSLQALSASGGLRAQSDTAVSAYGNKSTAKAAGASIDNVLSNFSRAGSSAGQLAEALGVPLLRPIGIFAATVGHATSGLAGIANSKVGGTLIAVGSALGLAAMALRKVSGFGFGAAAVRQGVTSGPVGSFVAGRRMAMGEGFTRNAAGEITQVGRAGLMGRTAGVMAQSNAMGTLGTGFMGRARTGMWGIGTSVGDFQAAGRAARLTAAESKVAAATAQLGADHPYTQRLAAQAAGGLSLRQRASYVAGTAMTAYSSVMRSGLDAAHLPAPERADAISRRLSFMGGNFSGFAKDLARKPDIIGMTRMETAQANFTRSMAEGNRHWPAFTAGLRSIGGMYGQAVGAGPAAVGALGGGALRRGLTLGRGVGGSLLGGAGRLLTNPNVMLMGGLALGGAVVNNWRQDSAAQKSEAARTSQLSPTDFIDRYNEAIGRATASTTAFASSLSTSTKQVSTSVDNMAQALANRPQDIAAAQATPDKVINAYAKQSTPAQIAAQIRQSSPGGMAPAQVNAIKVDLNRQYGKDKVADVMKALNISPQGSFGPTSATGEGDVRTLVQAAGAIPANVKWGRDKTNIAEDEIYGKGNWTTGGSTGFGPNMGVKLKKSQTDILDSIKEGIDTRYSSQRGTLGSNYAQQSKMRAVNAAMGAAADNPDEAVVRDLNVRMAQTLGWSKDKKIPKITSSDIKAHKGNYIEALASKDKDFAAQWKDMQSGQGITLSGAGTPSGGQRSDLANSMQPFSMLRNVFDNTYAGRLQAPDGRQASGPMTTKQLDSGTAMVGAKDKMAASLLLPDDAKLATEAVQSFVAATMTAGGSLSDLAAQSQKAAMSVDPTSPAYARLQATKTEAAFQISAASTGKSSGQNLAESMTGAAKIVNQGVDANSSPQEVTDYNAARQTMKDDVAAYMAQTKQKLAMQRSYEIQSKRNEDANNLAVGRATDSFNLSQQFAAEDYYKQRGYAQVDYQKSTARSARDFNTSASRSEQDFFISQARSQRDFNKNAVRSDEDYLTTRSRSIRDFNIQLARQVEDQTKALYDPYARIQTQAVWDGKQLLMNMGEQNTAISNQKNQLGQVKKMGLSTATIQQLGLNDPANAQQLAKLVDDFMSDPKLIKQLNDSTSTRLTVGKLLITDPTNKDMQRARDDFNKQLADSNADFQRALSRTRADFKQSMLDSTADYGKSRIRNKADFDRSMADSAFDFMQSTARQDDAYAVSVARASTLFGIQLANMRTDYDISVKNMKQDLLEAQSEITLTIPQMWDAVNKIVQNKSVDTNRFMTSGFNDSVNFLKSGKNVDEVNRAYKSVFPYDLSKVFGGPTPGKNPPHGGPYAPIANAGAQAAMFNNVGSHGQMVTGASVSQGFGSTSGGPNTGGGWPVSGGFISGGFMHDGKHPGIDLAVGRGTPIKSPLPGVVVYAAWNGGYGNCTIMDNGGGRSTLFGHQQKTIAKVGDTLKAGDLIGLVDSTGNSTGDHLHFETRQNGKVQDPAYDLPRWQATAGLGSFDPAATMAGYGVSGPSNLHKLKLSDYQKKNRGPWGAYMQMYAGLQDLAKQQADANLSGNIPGSVTPYAGSGNQLSNAKIIAGVAKDMNLGRRGAEIGIMTALAESTLLNLNYGDRDSLGLFQQRPSQGWGSKEQILDPKYATRKFFDTMLSMAPGWKSGDMGNIAQTVQRSGFPGRYDEQLPEAESILKQIGMYKGGMASKATLGIFGERGKEALIPLDARGVTAMAQAMRQAIPPDELKSMTTSGHSVHISYVNNITQTDHSVNIEADHLEVLSNDPVDMAHKLEAQSRAGRITKRQGSKP